MDCNALPKKKKQKKNHYFQSAKRFKSGILESGMKGVLITCNNSENQCVREAYNLLNEYADDVFGPENEVFQDCNARKNFDLEEELENEIKALKSTKGTHRFQKVNTKVKNVIFIRASVPDPTKLIQVIFEDIIKGKKRKSRYIMKMTPVTMTCKTLCDALKTNIFEFIEEISKNNSLSTTYKVVCKVRHNSGFSKDHIVWYCREAVEKFLPSWSPSLTDPESVISVDVLQSICCFGILRNFSKYKKYNLAEVLNQANINESKALVDAINQGSIINNNIVNPVNDIIFPSSCSQLNKCFEEQKRSSSGIISKVTPPKNKCNLNDIPNQENGTKLVSSVHGSKTSMFEDSTSKFSDVDISKCSQSHSQDAVEDIDLFFSLK